MYNVQVERLIVLAILCKNIKCITYAAHSYLIAIISHNVLYLKSEYSTNGTESIEGWMFCKMFIRPLLSSR